MAESVYEILDNENLSKFNTGRGRQIVYSRNPEVTYRLPESEINVYTHEPKMEDLLHPFRPSGDVILEAFVDGKRKFFSGMREDFESVDSELMDRIEGLESFRGYKQFNAV
jgi:hypothetical protein